MPPPLLSRPPVGLEAVLITAQLPQRTSRAADFQAENNALCRLANEVSASPTTLLHTLALTARELCSAGSAGISLLEKNSSVFRWHAISGVIDDHVWGTAPRNFSPCGVVLDRQSAQLFSRPHLHFDWLSGLDPLISEALLVPFRVNDGIMGTVWVVTHDENRHFDNEDVRLITNLSNFAAAAHTLQESLHRMKEADRRKDEFLAILGHELRNPLFPIQNAVQYLKTCAPHDQSIQSASDIAVRQVARMKRLIDDLLDIARINAGKIELRKEKVNVTDVIGVAIETSQPIIEARNHGLIVSAFDKDLYIEVDPVRVSQIVSNLLNNAAQYTGQGGTIQLIVGADRDEVVITVRDNGAGIAEEYLATIFDPFRQADKKGASEHGGLGLGLALARNLMRLHGGSITARSGGIGRGAEFDLRFKACPPPGNAACAAPCRDDSTDQLQSPPTRILVVDDNEDAAESLAMLLQVSGYEVRVAYDGTSGLKLVDEFRPHVVLHDLGLPGMSGYEVARILSSRPAATRATLVAISGYAQPEDRLLARNAGFDHHLSKPVSLADIEQVIRPQTSGQPARG